MWRNGIVRVAVVVLLGSCAVAAAAAEGDQEPREGFLARGLAAQQSKVFDVAGDFSIAGFLGVGTDNPLRAVHLRGRNAVFRMDRDANTAAFLLVRTAQNDFGTVLKTYVVGANAAGTDDGAFVINDLGTNVQGAGTRRLTIDNDGNFRLNTDSPLAALQVHGTGGSFLLGLLDGGAARLTVDSSGVLVINQALGLFRSPVSPGGYVFSEVSSTLADVSEGVEEEAWLALNGANALLASPGDGVRGLFSIFDQDNVQLNPAALPRYTFLNNELQLRGAADKTLRAPDLDNNSVLAHSTSGFEIRSVVDDDGDRAQVGGFTYRWFQTDTTNTNTLMGLDQDGDFGIAGSLFENNAFDLAEAFWKGDAAIEAGDVVSVSSLAANAVELADSEADPAVIGVASTDPGIIMGGGAFSLEHLAEVWGDEVAGIFESERADLETEALAGRPDLVELASALESFDGFVARLHGDGALGKAASKPEDLERLRSEYGKQLDRLGQELESAALEVFFQTRFVRLALAGRVPVKVDADYGAIRAGDLLVASPTPGHAMRADDPAPGTVIGKALEPLGGGTGRVTMLVMMR